ncbi:MAG TPA: hypothetical protein VF523_07225 [Burkholderiales bacterium]
METDVIVNPARTPHLPPPDTAPTIAQPIPDGTGGGCVTETRA